MTRARMQESLDGWRFRLNYERAFASQFSKRIQVLRQRLDKIGDKLQVLEFEAAQRVACKERRKKGKVSGGVKN